MVSLCLSMRGCSSRKRGGKKGLQSLQDSHKKLREQADIS
jgi:hypothetical protein